MSYFRSDMSGAVVWFGWSVLCHAKLVSGGAVLAVATVEGCCLLLLCTVSSVTGQCEVFSHGLVAIKLWVHCGHCAGSMPLLIPTD